MSKNQAEMEDLAAELSLPDFDLMLVGDGSGNFVNTPCGWFCTLYSRKNGKVWSHFGGANGGTNNYAELMPYVHSLWAYQTEVYGNKGDFPQPPLRVVIVSDSELTVRCGTRKPDGTTVYARRANAALWAAIEWFEKHGYQLNWHHVRRNTNAFSTKADSVAGIVRQSVGQVAG